MNNEPSGIDLDKLEALLNAATPADEHDFKNFHRLLCERFGYTHAQQDATPMYQAQFDGEYGSSVWRDVTEAAYHTFIPKHRRIVYAVSPSDATGKADDTFTRVLDALHKHLPYPTEACTIVHAMQRGLTIPETTGKADAANAGVQWISVKDLLPATEHECTSRDLMVSNSFYVRGIAVDGGEGFGLADYQEDGKWHCYGGDYDFMHLAEVTHYLPIRSTATSAADAKDAARYRVLRQNVKPADVSIVMTRVPPAGQSSAERIDMLCDLFIERQFAAMAAAPSGAAGKEGGRRMTEHEHTRKRLHIVEAALRSLMATVIEVLPPRLGDELNRMGWEWDKTLDALDAEFKSKSPAQEPGEQQAKCPRCPIETPYGPATCGECTAREFAESEQQAQPSIKGGDAVGGENE